MLCAIQELLYYYYYYLNAFHMEFPNIAMTFNNFQISDNMYILLTCRPLLDLPVSQLVPANPCGHVHVYALRPSTHMPPFKHGLGRQLLISDK